MQYFDYSNYVPTKIVVHFGCPYFRAMKRRAGKKTAVLEST